MPTVASHLPNVFHDHTNLRNLIRLLRPMMHNNILQVSSTNVIKKLSIFFVLIQCFPNEFN